MPQTVHSADFRRSSLHAGATSPRSTSTIRRRPSRKSSGQKMPLR